MNEYIIVGDTEKFSERLVKTCGTSYDRALEILEETKRDGFEGHTNFRIKEVEERYCWWNPSSPWFDR